MLKRVLYSFIGLFAIAVVVALTAGIVLWYYSRDLPDYEQLRNYNPGVVTRLYARDGQMFKEYALEKRVFVPLNIVPKRLINAFLSAEDKDFYHHNGIDFLGIARAFVNNLSARSSERRQGASTITQQVVKNFLVGNAKSYARKIKEAILAYKIESVFTKDKILEIYLNEIYLGQGVYGVAAAALTYFDKSLHELTISECAYIAALAKSPVHYDCKKFEENAFTRKNWVIRRMHENGFINAQEAELAVVESAEYKKGDAKTLDVGDYFAEDVRKIIRAKYGQDALYKGGLYVKTTLDPGYQEKADKALRKGLIEYDKNCGWRGPLLHAKVHGNISPAIAVETLKKISKPVGAEGTKLALVFSMSNDTASVILEDGSNGTINIATCNWMFKNSPRLMSKIFSIGDVILVEESDKDHIYQVFQVPEVNGALIAVNPHNGHVLAMSGGFSFAASEFNRATQAYRQTGSAFKIFVYLAAIEKNFAPNMIIRDDPISIDLGHGLGVWRPRNIDGNYLGAQTIRFGLERSRNMITIRLAQLVGMKNISRLVKALGVMDGIPNQLAYTLGAGETTVMKMAGAVCALANGGKKVEPFLIEKIHDKNGKLIFKNSTHTCVNQDLKPWITDEVPYLIDNRECVIDKESAYQMTSMLEGVVTRGTGVRANIGKPLAGKTGTTNEWKDAWFIGYTPDIVIAIYIGYDKPKSLGNMATGGRWAAPIGADFLKSLNLPAKQFLAPKGMNVAKINRITGAKAQSGDEDVIYEFFKKGQNLW